MANDLDPWLAELIEAMERAIAPVRSDLERTCDLDVSIRITVEDGYPRVWISNGISDGYANGPLPEDDEAAKADMADYVQEQLMDQMASSFWPTCREHNRGLHAEVHAGAAVWFCRDGDHTVAAIGQLVVG